MITQFKYGNVTFFDSKDIRVGVNIVTSKEIEDNKEIDLIYEHKNSIAINPSAFLVWAFKHDDGRYTTAYTSYPHIRNIKLIMTDVVNHITNDLGQYVSHNTDKKWISNSLGSSNQTLSFILSTDLNDVIIELNNSAGDAIAGAALKPEMFMALYEAVEGVNLGQISVDLGLAYLNGSTPLPPKNENHGNEKYEPRKSTGPQSGYQKPNSGNHRQ